MAAGLGVVPALAGCNAFYTADVRNFADQPVMAELKQGGRRPDGSVIARRRVPPGDRGKIGPIRAPKNAVIFLEVDFAGNEGYPARLDLPSGTTVVNVERIDEGAIGRIRLKEIRE